MINLNIINAYDVTNSFLTAGLFLRQVFHLSIVDYYVFEFVFCFD